jgi:hypothetical protein
MFLTSAISFFVVRSDVVLLTTKNDIALVRNMVLSYMQNQRSIMLAVVPANADIDAEVALIRTTNL